MGKANVPGEGQRRWNSATTAPVLKKSREIPMPETVEERLKACFEAEFGADAADIEDITAMSEFSADSLDIVELAIAVEDEFGIEVDDEEEYPETFGGWLRLVESELQRRAEK